MPYFNLPWEILLFCSGDDILPKPVNARDEVQNFRGNLTKTDLQDHTLRITE
jgi:hypothetical protein